MPPGYDTMLDTERARSLAREGRGLSPTLQVGKNGVTPQLIAELTEQLRQHKLVKVKILTSAIRGSARDEILKGLAHGSRAYLVEARGNTALFFKS
jgi:RNA-binding protein